MDLYMSGCGQFYNGLMKFPKPPREFSGLFWLDTFFSLRTSKATQKGYKIIRATGEKFMLDSGVFTMMNTPSSLKHLSLDDYVLQYCEWVKENNPDLFVEMDVDSIFGLKKAEQLRARIESLTGRQPLPVWHSTRGKDYYIGMCKDYPYVAFGGLLTDGFKMNALERAFPWFIDTAHENGAKIHGLGYTSFEGMKKYHFDSVDSTSWLSGGKYGSLVTFDPRTRRVVQHKKPAGTKLDTYSAHCHNYYEWRKIQAYAKARL